MFDKSIVSNSIPDAPAGSLAVIFDAKRAFAAIGLWDPASPIRIRILHVGKPTQIDGAFWEQRVHESLELRSSLGEDTTGWRVIHGENDRLPGFIVDRYDTTLVVKVYSPCWLPHLADVLEALNECAAFVNWRRTDRGEPALLALAYYR